MSADNPKHWRHVLRRANEHMLFAEDLGPKGTHIAVEIVDSGIIAVKTQGGSNEMPWIAFRGKKKKLGLNKTNSKTLETICGTPDYELWRGWITLVVIRTKAPDRDSGTMVETDAIRIAPQRPVADRTVERARNEKPGTAPRPAQTSTAPPITDDERDERAEIERLEREGNR